MTISSGGSPRRARCREAADTGDMSSNSPTAAGSSSVSMARSITSIPTAPRRIPGCLTTRSGRTRQSGSACTPRPPRSHRRDAAFWERGRGGGSGYRQDWALEEAARMGSPGRRRCCSCAPEALRMRQNHLWLRPAGTGRARRGQSRSGPMPLGSDGGVLQEWGACAREALTRGPYLVPPGPRRATGEPDPPGLEVGS